MKWRLRADHGQKHETGERMHSELDQRGPITEATERKTYVRDGSSVLFLVGAESLSHVTATDSDTGQRELGGNAAISHAR